MPKIQKFQKNPKKKHSKKWKKTENALAIISVMILQKYVFIEIRDQEVLKNLDIVLIIKSETTGRSWPKPFHDFIIKRKASLHFISLTIKKFINYYLLFFIVQNSLYYIRYRISSFFSIKSRNTCLKTVLKMHKKPYFCWLKSSF
jgi:hypothetical protein